MLYFYSSYPKKKLETFLDPLSLLQEKINMGFGSPLITAVLSTCFQLDKGWGFPQTWTPIAMSMVNC